MQDTLEENKSILNKVNKELNFTITSNEKLGYMERKTK